MKLAVDLLGCQTESRMRGIGRYALALTREMARLRAGDDLVVLADSLYEAPFENLRKVFTRLLPAGSFLPYHHEPIDWSQPEEKVRDAASIAETLVRQAYRSISPDVVLCCSPFEGWMEPGVVPAPVDGAARPKYAAVLHDLIPFIFKREYLDRLPAYKRLYLEQIGRAHV